MKSIVTFIWQLRRGIVALGLLYFGTYQTYMALAFNHPQVIAYSDFVRRMPKLGWYRITNVTLDFDRAVSRDTARGISGRYIPAIDRSGRIDLVVRAYDQDEPLDRHGRQTKTVDGTVEFGADAEETLDRDVMPLKPQLVESYRVIDENARPHLGFGLVAGIGGLILGLLVGLGSIGYALEARQTRLRSSKHIERLPPMGDEKCRRFSNASKPGP